MNLDTSIVRTIWTLVEASNPYSLLKLSDGELIQQLIKEIEKVFSLSPDESKTISKYIGSRTMLIRDSIYSKVD